MSKTIRGVYGLALLFGALAIAAAPAVLQAQGQIKCEKCTCDTKTGICECTNCTISPT